MAHRTFITVTPRKGANKLQSGQKIMFKIIERTNVEIVLI